MSDEKPISEDDRDLFREAVGKVKPVQSDRTDLAPRKPSSNPRSLEADNKTVMGELLSEFSETDLLETGDYVAWTAPGIQRSVLRSLKSGKYARQAEIDLHGFNKEEARKQIREFLAMAADRGFSCVRVIHGKGRKNVESAPVLKPAVTAWLTGHKQILAFCSARDMDGGTGAMYVLLRKKRQTG